MYTNVWAQYMHSIVLQSETAMENTHKKRIITLLTDVCHCSHANIQIPGAIEIMCSAWELMKYFHLTCVLYYQAQQSEKQELQKKDIVFNG